MTAPRLPAAAPIPLAEPGAGLPFLEGLISRYWLLPRSAKRMTWQDVDAMIEREGAKVLRVYEALKTEKATHIAKQFVLGKLEGQNQVLRKYGLKRHDFSVAENVQNLKAESAKSSELD